MRLSEFIRTRPDAIEREWEKFAGTLTPFAPASTSFSTSSYDLREILWAIADDMESPQTSAEQRAKSHGKALYKDALDRITREHASLRLDSGFDLEHVVAEYRALRASVLWLWAETNPSNEEQASTRYYASTRPLTKLSRRSPGALPTGQRVTATASSAFWCMMCVVRCT